MHRIIFSILFFSSLYLFISCEKTDDYSKLKLDYAYDGSFSLPIGDTSLSLSNNGYRLPNNWSNLPDELLQQIDTFPIRSSVNFSFINPISSLNYIQQIIFRLDAQNEFPLEIQMKFFFVSADGSVLDTLIEPIIIPHAKIATNGAIIENGEKLIDIKILENHFFKWLHVTNMVVYAYLINNREAINYYRYFPDYKLDLNMGFRVYFDFDYHRSL